MPELEFQTNNEGSLVGKDSGEVRLFGAQKPFHACVAAQRRGLQFSARWSHAPSCWPVRNWKRNILKWPKKISLRHCLPSGVGVSWGASDGGRWWRKQTDRETRSMVRPAKPKIPRGGGGAFRECPEGDAWMNFSSSFMYINTWMKSSVAHTRLEVYRHRTLLCVQYPCFKSLFPLSPMGGNPRNSEPTGHQSVQQ